MPALEVLHADTRRAGSCPLTSHSLAQKELLIHLALCRFALGPENESFPIMTHSKIYIPQQLLFPEDLMESAVPALGFSDFFFIFLLNACSARGSAELSDLV